MSSQLTQHSVKNKQSSLETQQRMWRTKFKLHQYILLMTCKFGMKSQRIFLKEKNKNHLAFGINTYAGLQKY